MAWNVLNMIKKLHGKMLHSIISTSKHNEITDLIPELQYDTRSRLELKLDLWSESVVRFPLESIPVSGLLRGLILGIVLKNQERSYTTYFFFKKSYNSK